jgi:hypothetical protein
MRPPFLEMSEWGGKKNTHPGGCVNLGDGKQKKAAEANPFPPLPRWAAVKVPSSYAALP